MLQTTATFDPRAFEATMRPGEHFHFQMALYAPAANLSIGSLEVSEGLLAPGYSHGWHSHGPYKTRIFKKNAIYATKKQARS